MRWVAAFHRDALKAIISYADRESEVINEQCW